MATLTVDENGYLVSQASAEKITGKWREAADAVLASCKEHLGDRLIALYIGGSVATGSAVEGKSDIDCYGVVDLNEAQTKEMEERLKNDRKRIHAAFPFLRGVEIHLSPVGTISEGRKFQLKLLAAHLYGTDIAEDLPSYKLDKETLGRIRVSVAKDLEKARTEFASADNAKIEKAAIWIAKRLLRSAGMLVLWKGTTFTMDPKMLATLFTISYPEQRESVEKLLALADRGLENKRDTLALLDSFGTWLIEEDARVFDPRR